LSGFLLDTNVPSELRKRSPNAGLIQWLRRIDELKLYLSVLTIAEFRIGIEMERDKRKQGDLESWLVSDVMPRFSGRILPFDLSAAERWALIEGRARRASGKLPTVDAMLAATALDYGLTIVTRNETHFARTGVTVLNPWT
jgi:predicted nucleic acid-binding protein